ncbi:MAG: DnaB-like helicase C-terminal domain-containing protein [Deltaproteobacteria bacterium]|jgi:replicative DNA helicase|nr:DnaB-like helicase C-terminal domain-containing protein [Deltaproteobacteria bacterium]MBW2532532.1 DnaB-like helicase C-terminal domain-containing protein [Deltaproteobacteria bacterium]
MSDEICKTCGRKLESPTAEPPPERRHTPEPPPEQLHAPAPSPEQLQALDEDLCGEHAPRAPDAEVPVLRDALVEAFSHLAAAADRGGDVTGIPTGFHDLDTATGGLHRGDLVVLAARPGMGKSAFVSTLVTQLFEEDDDPANEPTGDQPGSSATDPPDPRPGALLFSLRRPRVQLALRLVCSYAGIDLERFRSRATRDDWGRLTEAASKLSTWPVWIDDRLDVTTAELARRVRQVRAESRRALSKGAPPTELAMVIVDELLLMTTSPTAKPGQLPTRRLLERLKQLATDEQVAMLLLAELHDDDDDYGDAPRPELADLDEREGIARLADVVLFLHSKGYYAASVRREPAELIIAANRHGPLRTVKLRYLPKVGRFTELLHPVDAFGAGDP